MSRINEERWEEVGDGSYRRRSGAAGTVEEDGPNATDAAVALADELGVDLSAVEGTGAEGRITVGDVRAASEG